MKVKLKLLSQLSSLAASSEDLKFTSLLQQMLSFVFRRAGLTALPDGFKGLAEAAAGMPVG